MGQAAISALLAIEKDFFDGVLNPSGEGPAGRKSIQHPGEEGKAGSQGGIEAEERVMKRFVRPIDPSVTFGNGCPPGIGGIQGKTGLFVLPIKVKPARLRIIEILNKRSPISVKGFHTVENPADGIEVFMDAAHVNAPVSEPS